jgi:hypothetical protein
MPISYKHRIIFVHIPKCAGSSVQRLIDVNTIDELCFQDIKKTSIYVNPKKFSVDDVVRLTHRTAYHYTYSELKKLLPFYFLKNFFVFSVVRNPYSRIVSEYHYLLYQASINKAINSYVPESFQSFLTKLDHTESDRIQMFEGHLEPQVSFLTDGEHISTNIKIYRYENLAECFAEIKQKTNGTVDYHTRKSHIDKPYQEYYTQELQDKVYKFYKEDFDKFNYGYNI